MRPIYGIDLGTTYSKCAIVRPEDRVLKVFNLDNDSASSQMNTMPILRSAVTLTSENERRTAYVGNRSWSKFLEWDALSDPPLRRFEESKLWIGEQRGSDADAAPWHFDGFDYLPEDIGSLVLRKIKREVELDRGPIMERVVVTHPQNFSETKREATRKAVQLAGLELADTLTEPDAAAIAYRGQNVDGAFMVFDLGGGTLDITIARISTNRTDVLTSEGIRQGGRDWDRAIFNRMIEHYHDSFPDFSREVLDDATRQDWLQRAERLKWRLCQPDVLPDDVRAERIECRNDVFQGMQTPLRLRRSDFEALTQSLVDDCERCARLAMSHKGMNFSELTGILLVGSSTHVPKVREMLTRISGKTLLANIDPSVAVAQGAALYAYELEQGKPVAASVPGIGSAPTPTPAAAASIGVHSSRTSVLSKALGVRALDKTKGREVIVNLVPKDSAIPSSNKRSFETLFPDQRELNVELYEGEGPDPQDCELLGSCTLTGIPTGPAGQAVQVTIRLDINGSKHMIVHVAGRQHEEAIRYDPERVVPEESVTARQAFLFSIEVK